MPDRDGRSDAQRAYDLGVTATQTKTTLDAHEKRLAAINGSIERTGSELRKIHACLDELVSDRKTRAAVEAALASSVEIATKEVQAATASQVSVAASQTSKWEFRFHAIGLALVIVGSLYLGRA